MPTTDERPRGAPPRGAHRTGGHGAGPRRTGRYGLLIATAAFVVARLACSGPDAGPDLAAPTDSLAVDTIVPTGADGPAPAAAQPIGRVSTDAGGPLVGASGRVPRSWPEAWAITGGRLPRSFELDDAEFAVWVEDLDDADSGAGLNGDVEMLAASTIKLLVLAGVLEFAQSEDRPLTTEERALAEPMIAWSDNDATAKLVDHLERKWMSLADIGGRWGLADVRNPAWGLSTVTARQMTYLVSAMFGGQRLLPDYQREAWRILELVDPDVTEGWRIGVGHGLPTDWRSVSKSGVLVWEENDVDGLHVHGVGLVRSPDAHSYAVAILSRGWDDYGDLDRAVDKVNQVGGFVSYLLASVDDG